MFKTALDVAGPDRLIFGTDSSIFPRGLQRLIYDPQRTALNAIGVGEKIGDLEPFDAEAFSRELLAE